MNLYVYSDESGTFDHVHNHYYVYGGLIVLGSENKSKWEHRYAAAERTVRENAKLSRDSEIKGNNVTAKQKAALFRSLNKCYKFAVVVDEHRVFERIYASKKDKQRYLDYVYKITIRRALENLIQEARLCVDDVENIYFFVDEHSTATNGRYELREALEQELKSGTYNYSYTKFFKPLFPDMGSVCLEYCDSKKKLLVRAADIVSNKILHMANDDDLPKVSSLQNMFMLIQP
ncbi:MAG: DUF3800 domain-containing protein [Lachnospiraceae bacterium]|nr:DUF3800 domain-containing protein [Lachnospiraceae bacterium]